MSASVVIVVLALVGSFFSVVIIQARRSMLYVYCSATTSAWEARLLSEARLMEFVDSPRIVNVLASLDDTDYRTYLADIPRVEDIDVIAVERALKANLSARYRGLLEILPKERKATIGRVVQRVDLWNLKVLLTAIHNKVPREKRLGETINSPTFPRERLELLASAENFKELLEYFKGTEYFDVLAASLEDYEKLGLIAVLSALDKQYYTALWKDVLSKKVQRPILKVMLGYEIDAVNIKLILRLKKEGVSPDEITKHLILPSHELSEGMLREMIVADDIPSAIRAISRTTYGPVLLAALPQFEATGSLFAFEKALDEGLLRVCKWMSAIRLFSIAPAITHIHLKETEVRNLRTIIRLKADRVEPEKIKETLVKVPKLEL
jgi:V/A-type H+-transporting ATPase subunit C